MIIRIMLALGVFLLIQHLGLCTDIAHRGTLTLSTNVTPIQLLAESNNQFDFFGLGLVARPSCCQPIQNLF